MKNRKLVVALNNIYACEGLTSKQFPVKFLFALYQNLEQMEKAGEVYTKAKAAIDAIEDKAERKNKLEELLEETADVTVKKVDSRIIEEWDGNLSLDEFTAITFMLEDLNDD